MCVCVCRIALEILHIVFRISIALGMLTMGEELLMRLKYKSNPSNNRVNWLEYPQLCERSFEYLGTHIAMFVLGMCTTIYAHGRARDIRIDNARSHGLCNLFG